MPEGHIRPLGIVPLAAWFGLVTGYLELITNIIKCNYTDPRYYNVSQHFLWMFPVAGLMVLGMAALPLALLAGFRPKVVSLGIATGWLSLFSYLGLLMRLPIYTLACLLLAVGLARQTARLVAPRRARFHWFFSRTLVGLVGLLVLLIGVSFSRQMLAEQRALARLPAAPPGTRNVLLIVLDTVRAQNMSLYGYERDTTPNLARLAKKGVRFDQALSTAPWTTPSHASLFTGRWPHELSAGWKEPLDSTYATLAEFLSARGYRAAGFVANTYYCSYETGLNRGFAHYEDYDVTPTQILLCSSLVQRGLTIARNRLGRWGLCDDVRQPNTNRKSAARINRDFLAWLDHQQKQPFFAFLNYYDAHHPYLVPNPRGKCFGLRPVSRSDYAMLRSWWDSDKRKLSKHDVELARDGYDNCIAYLDQQLAALLAELEQRRVLDNTLVVITADHGEHLGEQGLYGHGASLYRPELHVPLLIVSPHKVPSGQCVREAVSLSDVPATVLELLGIKAATPFPGHSLARYWESAPEAERRSICPVLSEIEAPPESDPNHGRSPVCRGPMQSLLSEAMHYIRNGDGREELFDFENDPAEAHDLAETAEYRPILEQLREALDQISGDLPPR